MREVLETTLPLLNPDNGLACWVIGDVKELNLAKLVWDKVGSQIEVRDSNGNDVKYRLLGIVADEIKDVEKVTRIWKSQTDKSGKATPVDRILIICRDGASPESFISNDEITWNPLAEDEDA
jgi:hypothetical protein